MWYRWLLFKRPDSLNILYRGGMLFQQIVCDTYVAIKHYLIDIHTQEMVQQQTTNKLPSSYLLLNVTTTRTEELDPSSYQHNASQLETYKVALHRSNSAHRNNLLPDNADRHYTPPT